MEWGWVETPLGSVMCFPGWGWQGNGLCGILCYFGRVCVCVCVCVCGHVTLVIPRCVSWVTLGVPPTGCDHSPPWTSSSLCPNKRIWLLSKRARSRLSVRLWLPSPAAHSHPLPPACRWGCKSQAFWERRRCIRPSWPFSWAFPRPKCPGDGGGFHSPATGTSSCFCGHVAGPE